RHDHTTVVDLEVGLEQTTLREDGARASGPLPRADVDLLGALAVEPLVDLLGPFTTDQRPGSLVGMLVEVVGGGTLDRDATASARQQIARRRPGTRQVVEVDDVRDQLDR